MLVSLRDVQAAYAGKIVLALDQLDVAPGAHTLVLGPSGCGKTTLLNVIAGVISPLAGSVVVEGKSIAQMSGSQRDQFRGQRIGLVMQRLHLIGALTVAANLELAQTLAGLAKDRARIDGVLAALDIAGKHDRRPRTLSQGEAQRVAIARAVINRPALILADEPTAALDDDNANAALDLLFAQASEHGATLIVATHDARIKSRFAHVLQLSAHHR